MGSEFCMTCAPLQVGKQAPATKKSTLSEQGELTMVIDKDCSVPASQPFIIWYILSKKLLTKRPCCCELKCFN